MKDTVRSLPGQPLPLLKCYMRLLITDSLLRRACALVSTACSTAVIGSGRVFPSFSPLSRLRTTPPFFHVLQPARGPDTNKFIA